MQAGVGLLVSDVMNIYMICNTPAITFPICTPTLAVSDVKLFIFSGSGFCLRVLLSLSCISYHVIMCIASSCFQNLHPFGFPQFSLLSVPSPDTLARARGMSEIVFYKWPVNVLGMGRELTCGLILV